MENVKDTSWHEAFLENLRETCNVSAAARAAGVSRSTAHRHRSEDEQFKEAWEDAIEEGVDALELEARRRALEGCKKPVYQGGVLVGHVQEYSDTLAIFLLKAHRPEKYRERQDVKVSGTLSISQLMAKADKHGD